MFPNSYVGVCAAISCGTIALVAPATLQAQHGGHGHGHGGHSHGYGGQGHGFGGHGHGHYGHGHYYGGHNHGSGHLHLYGGSYYPYSFGYNYPHLHYSTYPSYSYGLSPAYTFPATAAAPVVRAVAPAANSVSFEVTLPDAQGEVWFDGVKTRAVGTSRTFNSPPLDPAKSYTYQVTAAWHEGGRLVTRERTIDVIPGQRYAIDFTRPQTEGERLLVPAEKGAEPRPRQP